MSGGNLLMKKNVTLCVTDYFVSTHGIHMESNKLMQQIFHKNMFINNRRRKLLSLLNTNALTISDESKRKTQEYNAYPNVKWQFDKPHHKKKEMCTFHKTNSTKSTRLNIKNKLRIRY